MAKIPVEARIKPSRQHLAALLATFLVFPRVADADQPWRLAALMPAPISPVATIPRLRTDATPERHPALRALAENSIYDETNPAYLQLQRLQDASRDLKRDDVGFPDWMEALRSGAIAPRASVSGQSAMAALDLDIVMKNTKEMPNVLFPHRSHTLWLDCSNCHPVPFLPLAGRNTVNMSEIFRGQYCGMCHDRVAFVTFFACARCHNVAQNAPPRSP